MNSLVTWAMKFLLSKKWFNKRDIDFLQSRALVRSTVESILFEDKIVREISTLASRSLAEGWSAERWREESQAVYNLANYETEAIGRTLVHNAYLDGRDAVVASVPTLGAVFTIKVYYATRDTRTRPTHRALDGKRARVGSPLAALMDQRLREYNCRCSQTLEVDDGSPIDNL